MQSAHPSLSSNGLPDLDQFSVALWSSGRNEYTGLGKGKGIDILCFAVS